MAITELRSHVKEALSSVLLYTGGFSCRQHLSSHPGFTVTTDLLSVLVTEHRNGVYFTMTLSTVPSLRAAVAEQPVGHQEGEVERSCFV